MGLSNSKNSDSDIKDVKRALNCNIRELDRQILAAERHESDLVKRMKYKHANDDVEGAKSLAQEISNNRKVIANYKSTKSQCKLLLSKVTGAHSMNKLTANFKKSCAVLKRDNMNLKDFQNLICQLETYETQEEIKHELMEESFISADVNFQKVFDEFNLKADKSVNEIGNFKQRILNLTG